MRDRNKNRWRKRSRSRTRSRQAERRYAAVGAQVQAISDIRKLGLYIDLFRPYRGGLEANKYHDSNRSEGSENEKEKAADMEQTAPVANDKESISAYRYRLHPDEDAFVDEELYENLMKCVLKDKGLYESPNLNESPNLYKALEKARGICERWADKRKRHLGARVSPPMCFPDEFLVEAKAEKEKLKETEGKHAKEKRLGHTDINKEIDHIEMIKPVYQKLNRIFDFRARMWGLYAENAKCYRTDLIKCMRSWLALLRDPAEYRKEQEKFINLLFRCQQQEERSDTGETEGSALNRDEIERYFTYPLYSMHLINRLVEHYGHEVSDKVLEIIQRYHEEGPFKKRSKRLPERMHRRYKCGMEVARAVCGLWDALPLSYVDDFWKGYRMNLLGEIMPEERYFKFKIWQHRCKVIEVDLRWHAGEERYIASVSDQFFEKIQIFNELKENAVIETLNSEKKLDHREFRNEVKNYAYELLNRLHSDYRCRLALAYYMMGRGDQNRKIGYQTIDELFRTLEASGMEGFFHDIAKALMQALKDEQKDLNEIIGSMNQRISSLYGELDDLEERDTETVEEPDGWDEKFEKLTKKRLSLWTFLENINVQLKSMENAIKEISSSDGQKEWPAALRLDALLTPTVLRVLVRRHKKLKAQGEMTGEKIHELESSLAVQILEMLNHVVQQLADKFEERIEIKKRLIEVMATLQREYLLSQDIRDRQQISTKMLMEQCDITPERLKEKGLYKMNEQKAGGGTISSEEHERNCIRMIDRWLQDTCFRLADPDDGRVFRANHYLLRPRNRDGVNKHNRDWVMRDGRVVFNTHKNLATITEILREKGWMQRKKLQEELKRKGNWAPPKIVDAVDHPERTISDATIRYMVELVEEYGWFERYEW